MDRKLQDAVTDSPSQIDRFKETARALGCDKEEAAFDEKLKVITRSSLAEKKGDKSRSSTNKASKPSQP